MKDRDLTLDDMRKQLGISHAGMSYRVSTPLFKSLVEPVDTRARRRTWSATGFRKYVRALDKLDAMKKGERAI